ncbi:MAG TPA: hypothetical protein VM597_07505, partial [Gemmataceae bacterium]|nr:hypothetical protein [Gemmataceae bacterium]
MSVARMSTETAPPPSGGVRVQLLWQAVRRHPIAVLILVVLGTAAGAAVWFLLPLPKLTGVTVFHIAPQPPAVFAPTPESRVDFPTYKGTQTSLVRQRQVLSKALSDPEAKNLPTVHKEPDPLAYLDRNLQVDFKLGPEFMRVSIEGDDEAELMAILKAVSTAYLDKVDQMDNGRKSERKKDLEGMLAKLEATRNTLRTNQDSLLADGGASS